MIAIVNINSEKFTFNGIPYYKNFIGIVAGDNVHIVNVYDSKIALTKDGPVKYDEITVNGNSFASAALLQNALLPVLYTRNTLGGSGGGSQNLQQVLQQGSQALLNLAYGSVFEAQLPYDDGLNQNVLLRLTQDLYTSVLALGIGNAVLASSGQSGDKVFEYQKKAPAFNTAEGEFNPIDYLWVRNETNMVESGATINLPTPKEGTQIQYRFPYSLVTAILTLASEEYVDKAILQLINGAPSDANTLKELNDKIVALQAIVGGSDPDGNSIVDTVAELLAVFQTYPEGTDIATILAGKINNTDIVDNLTQLVPGKVLDARQGKILADLIAAKWTAVDATGILKGIMKLYTAFGSNTDGTMTQKAITEAFASITPIETTTDGTVTSGTSNTVSSWVLIPAGTYGVGMTLDTIANSKKTGANGTLTHRRYANTSPDLTGSPILLGSTSGAGGQLQLQLQRFLKIKTIDGSGLGTEITSTSTSPVSDYGVTTQAPVSVSINWQNDVYIIDSVQCASSSDSARVSSLKVRR